MNRIYRLVWNRARGQWVVADERSRAQGKSGGGRKGTLAKTALGTLALASGLAFAETPPAPNALPQGGALGIGSCCGSWPFSG